MATGVELIKKLCRRWSLRVGSRRGRLGAQKESLLRSWAMMEDGALK